LSNWDVSKVTNMRDMFKQDMYEATRVMRFNGDLSKWDVSRVTDMTEMFAHSTSFNGDLSKWNVSHNTLTIGMFHGDSCSLCGHVSPRLEATCRNSCHDASSPVVDNASALPFFLV